ncbi:MAG: TetR/AcrR family transcriptional regulator [Clostridiales bacterium]|nr:TetR/AcrR family transcriptional regulator [Clostridiales bacterium]
MKSDARSAMKWKSAGVENPLYTNAELWDAALGEFSERSFGESSLNDILKAAGINKGSFYYRFNDKKDLYLSVFSRLAVEKLELFRKYDDGNADADFFESIRTKAMLGIRFARKDPRYGSLSRRFLTEDIAFRDSVLLEFGGLSENFLLRMVEDAQKKGRIRADIAAEVLAEVFAILLERIDKVITPDMDDGQILLKVEELISVLRDGTAVA